MGEAIGVITVVQESRFKLADDSGRAKLFILSHSADVEPQDLMSLLQSGHRVVVRFDGLKGQIAAVATEILDSAAAAPR